MEAAISCAKFFECRNLLRERAEVKKRCADDTDHLPSFQADLFKLKSCKAPIPGFFFR